MTTTSLPRPDEMYAALCRRDAEYEGVFVCAVRTTGIFCRPTCPARKPRAENVDFYGSAAQALAAGYRPCRRCRPLEPAGATPAWLAPLLDAVDDDPRRRWTDGDLRALDLDPGRVRRWFRAVHGMTFHAYARARRLGLALGRIGAGDDLLATGYDHGWESDSGFRSAFADAFGAPPGGARALRPILTSRLPTPLGPMVAGATDDGLCLLEFADRRMLETQLARLRRHLGVAIVPGAHPLLDRTARALEAYFAGERDAFDVPLVRPGTPFQRAVWDALDASPYGATIAYDDLARELGRPGAQRAVGRANGDNRLAIVVPCHRVVRADGTLSGYGGGLWRKRWLIDHERAHAR